MVTHSSERFFTLALIYCIKYLRFAPKETFMLTFSCLINCARHVISCSHGCDCRVYFVGNYIAHCTTKTVFTPQVYARIGSVYGTEASENVAKWRQLVSELQSEDLDEKLYEINRFFNRFDFVDDLVHWQQKITGQRQLSLFQPVQATVKTIP